jgi:hypothetical protein
MRHGTDVLTADPDRDACGTHRWVGDKAEARQQKPVVAGSDMTSSNDVEPLAEVSFLRRRLLRLNGRAGGGKEAATLIGVRTWASPKNLPLPLRIVSILVSVPSCILVRWIGT